MQVGASDVYLDLGIMLLDLKKLCVNQSKFVLGLLHKLCIYIDEQNHSFYGVRIVAVVCMRDLSFGVGFQGSRESKGPACTMQTIGSTAVAKPHTILDAAHPYIYIYVCMYILSNFLHTCTFI